MILLVKRVLSITDIYFNQNQSVKSLMELIIAHFTKRNNMDYFDGDRDYFTGVYIIKA